MRQAIGIYILTPGEASKSNDKYKITAEDIANATYAMEHYSALYRGYDTKDGNTAIVYEYRTDNRTFYVVEAVPDTKAKTLYVVTAYKKTETSETTHANNVDLGETSKNENQSISATNSKPRSAEKSQVGDFVSGEGIYSTEGENSYYVVQAIPKTKAKTL